MEAGQEAGLGVFLPVRPEGMVLAHWHTIIVLSGDYRLIVMVSFPWNNLILIHTGNRRFLFLPIIPSAVIRYPSLIIIITAHNTTLVLGRHLMAVS